jgi:uncharacterized protein YmfQ (DUF2313 family)
MARSADIVLDELLTLSPPGWALPRESGSLWAQFLSVDASGISLAELSAEALLAEIDPRTATETLGDYERVLGPDPYGRDSASLDLTTAQQAQLAYARWTAGGNMAPADYIALAAASGVTITIQEYWVTQCGQAQCGQSLVGAIWGTSASGAPGWQPQWFKWLVSLPASLLVRAECGSAVAGESLGKSALVASIVADAILGEAPSHTEPVFLYS